MWKKIKQWFATLKKKIFPYRQPPEKGQTIVVGEENYELSKMTTGDIKELLALEREVYQGEAPWQRSAFLMELNSFYPHLYLVIRKNEKIVAFIGCRISQGDAHITNIAVHPDFQRKGLAVYLLSEAKAFAISHDSYQLSLEVRVSNNDAKRLYRKFGFVAFNIKEDYYTENKEDAVEMKYDLSDSTDK